MDAMNIFAIGSYTRHSSPSIDARGAGLSLIGRNSSGALELICSDSQLHNPTYAAWEPQSRTLYAVSELDGKKGAAASFRVDSSWNLHLESHCRSSSGSACHISLLADQNRLLTVSYGEGSLTGYELTGGHPSAVSHVHLYTGSGPDTARQSGSHAHQVLPSPFGPFIYVCDLGADTIWMHPLNDLNSPPRCALKLPGGYGPRHLAFAPNAAAAYILCELTPRLLAVDIDQISGEMTIRQDVEAAAFEHENAAAPAAVKVHPSGQTLAVSSRFDDSISVFAIPEEPQPAPLRLIERFSCGGKTPRDVEFDSSGGELLIANQDSHSITRRRFDEKTGAALKEWLPPFETGSPVCLVSLN